MNEPYKILIEGGCAETELKKSRFIAHLTPVTTEEEAQSFIQDIKKTYYDARHNCYAYIIGRAADKVKYSDDGEPSQTAGLPMFNVLKESGVRNVCVVVTRYFGGTLLGAGPLARMYAEAVKLGLEASKTGIMRYGIEASIESDYGNADKIRRFLEKENISIKDTVYSDKVVLFIRLSFEGYESAKEKITSISNGSAVISKISEAFYIDT